MVSKDDRVRPYHTRASHKEGCLCGPCKSKRGVCEVVTLDVVPPPEVVTPIPEPPLVAIGSLATAKCFEYQGKRYRVGEKTPETSQCAELTFVSDGPLPSDKQWKCMKVVGLNPAIMVKPVK